MRILTDDLRLAGRLLLKSPGFTAAAVLTLALGIGANTAIFSVVNAVLLRPLPYRDSQQIVIGYAKTEAGRDSWLSYPDVLEIRKQSSAFQAVSAYSNQSANITGAEEPGRIVAGFVDADFFRVLDVNPARGRVFSQAENTPGAPAVVVLSHGLWQGRYGGDPDIIGRKLTINNEPATVVGVMPEKFRFAWADCEAFLPFHKYPNYSPDRKARTAAVFARVRSGVKLETALAELATISGRLATQFPETNRGLTMIAEQLQSAMVRDLRQTLWTLLGAVVFVLLIGCANVANLMMTRTAARRRELSLRAALGASRLRIARQLLTESMLLAAIGGIAGILVGVWSVDALAKLAQNFLPETMEVAVDGAVLAYSAAVALFTGLLFGIAPAVQLGRRDLHDELRDGARGSQGASRSRFQNALAIQQIALAMVLLAGAGLMIESFRRILGVSTGFDAAGLLTMEYRVPRNKYPEGNQQWAFHQQVVENVRALPGVRSAAVVMALPFSGNGGMTTFSLLDRPAPAEGKEPRAQLNRGGPGYFETMRIPLLKGRFIERGDHQDASPVVVINQAMEQRYWPNDSALGRQIRVNDVSLTATVVGVVENVKQRRLDEPEAAQIYTAFAQTPFIFATLVVRAEGDPMSIANAVKGAVWAVDKDQPVWKVRTLELLVDSSLGYRRLILLLLNVFSGIALIMATIGIYGVVAYSAGRRTREIGVRIAVGAAPMEIMRMVARHGVVLVGSGTVLGVIAASLLTRLIEAQLYRVSATDPWTFVAAVVLLGAAAMTASIIPALRAARIDPVEALRHD